MPTTANVQIASGRARPSLGSGSRPPAPAGCTRLLCARAPRHPRQAVSDEGLRRTAVQGRGVPLAIARRRGGGQADLDWMDADVGCRVTPPTFEWDPAKAAANMRRHGVAFEEAVTTFQDPLARIHNDPVHSTSERREILVGYSCEGRLLVVSFTDRGSNIRLISARPATRRERSDYEEAE